MVSKNIKILDDGTEILVKIICTNSQYIIMDFYEISCFVLKIYWHQYKYCKNTKTVGYALGDEWNHKFAGTLPAFILYLIDDGRFVNLGPESPTWQELQDVNVSKYRKKHYEVSI